DGDRREAVQGRHERLDHLGDHQGHAEADHRLEPGSAVGSRAHRAPLSREGSRAALPDRRGSQERAGGSQAGLGQRSGAGAARRRVARGKAASIVALVALAAGAGAVAVWQRRAAATPPAEASFTVDRFARLTSTGTAFVAAISPDGRYVVHAKQEPTGFGLWMRQTATSSDVRIVPPADVRFDGLTFGPDGNYVYYNAYPGLSGVAALYRVPVLGGAAAKLIDDVDSGVAFSPDQKRI